MFTSSEGLLGSVITALDDCKRTEFFGTYETVYKFNMLGRSPHTRRSGRYLLISSSNTRVLLL